LVALPLFLAAGRPATQPVSPPGAIHLPDGYHHEPRQGIDSTVGRIWKDGGLEIQYDIGALAGNYAQHIEHSDRLWSMKQVVNGRTVDIVKGKDGRVVVSFAADDRTIGENYPANFWATVSSDEDLAALLAIALTYPVAR